jgi:hypothetical protein
MRRRIEVSVYQAHKYERVGASQPSVERRSAVALTRQFAVVVLFY